MSSPPTQPTRTEDRPECPIVLDRLPAFIAGDVPDAEARLIAAHLGGCTGCDAERSAFVEVSRALFVTLPQDDQERADQALFVALDAASSVSHRRTRWVAAAAAAALIASLGLLSPRTPGISLADLDVASRAFARSISLPTPRVDAMTLSIPTRPTTPPSAPRPRRSQR